MDIYVKKGSKVIVTEESIKNGYNYVEEHAREFLEVGKTYTIDHTEVDNFSTVVHLKEFPNETFNSVSFESISKRIKLKPCDCKDIATAKKLNTQGIGHNDQGIKVQPNFVLLTMGHTEIKIPMSRFKMFAEWYLEEQEIDG